MDLISDILRDLHLESAVLSIGEYRAPWGINKGSVGGAPFHIVVEGRCLLQVEDREPIELAPGDLVVLPHGGGHALLSDQEAPRIPFSRVLKENGVDGTWRPGKRVRQLDQLHFGGSGALTRVINGVFAFHDRRRNPLLEALPAVIHVPGRLGRGAVWLESSLNMLMDELASGRPGFQAIAERALDIVFLQAVRHHVASPPTNADCGWLRGLTDPQIAQALALVHEQPAEAWTVASLAKAAGMSRSVFADRFRSLVGLPVMEYVASRRMHVAAGLLMHSNEALTRIANGVGYESEISFSKAFRRWGGMPPGKYRRRMSASSIATPTRSTRARAAR